MIVKTDYRIRSSRTDYNILLRNKCLGDQPRFTPDKTVLFVHGATYGSTDTFDYEIEGISWMDVLASQGFDTWCLDLLGYGQSDRPAEMDQPAEDNLPLVDTAHAIVDVNHAFAHIFQKRGIDCLHLIGYSWGTAICGGYAGQYPDHVNKLVLSGALWVEGLSPNGKTADNIGAYRTVDTKSMLARWSTGLGAEEIDRLVSAQARGRWCEHTASCDPTYSSTGLLRAPTGVMKDYSRCRESGDDWYDPSLIASSVLIVVGELDIETTPAQGKRVFERLTAAPHKQITVIGAGTHSLLLENNRHQLHRVVSSFLLD